jgi:hypothetical protein|tara:strand:+ start:2524 stop:3756 length:1233 start_codon:yes stop_codon:yes gene_type:complete
MGTVHKLPETQQTEFGIAHTGEKVIESRAFINIASVDPCYRKVSNYVNEHNLEVEFYDKFNYRDAPLASPDNEFVKAAQARAGGLFETKKDDYKQRFDDGEKLDYATVMVEISGLLFLGLGNHRGLGLRESKNYEDKAIIIRQGNTPDEVQKNILFKVASMGNTLTKQDKDPDSMSDISQQVEMAWREIIDVDPASTYTTQDYERSILAEYNKIDVEDNRALDEFRKQWFKDWMLENKPLSFRHCTKQGQIYSGAFSEDHGQPIQEYTNNDLKMYFEKQFPDYDWDPDTWSMKTPHNKSIHQIAVQWKTFERNMFRQLAEPIHSGDSKTKDIKVHVIIEASASLRKLTSRNEEIETILKKMTGWNCNAATKSWGLGIIDKLALPKALRGNGDSDHAYCWNEQKSKFIKQK